MDPKSVPSRENPILTEHAAAIRALGKQTVESVVEIGRHLSEAKAEIRKLGMSWGDWLKAEFNWSDQQARRCMHIFERKSELNNLLNADLPVSALYLLAAPSTPKEARNEINERAQAGEKVKVAKVKRHKSQSSKRKQRHPASIRIPSSAEVRRHEKLGRRTVSQLRGASLGNAAEMDALIELNRGAPDGEHTAIVEKLITDARTGQQVSAVELVDSVTPRLTPASTVGQTDISMIERQAAHVQELQDEIRRLQDEIRKLQDENDRLESQISELESELKASKAEAAELRAELRGKVGARP